MLQEVVMIWKLSVGLMICPDLVLQKILGGLYTLG